jgi:ribosomal-protein-alanine N-acetyltransferase
MCLRKNELMAQLRPVTAREAELLTQIHRECFANYWNLDAFNDFFTVAGTYALLAEERESDSPVPAGMAVYRISHEQADIITLAVLPAFRRQGIARMLLIGAMEDAARLGAKAMFLDVEDGNTPAIKLYETFGFRQVNRRKLYYRQKDGSFTDALVMTKKLS